MEERQYKINSLDIDVETENEEKYNSNKEKTNYGANVESLLYERTTQIIYKTLI